MPSPRNDDEGKCAGAKGTNEDKVEGRAEEDSLEPRTDVKTAAAEAQAVSTAVSVEAQKSSVGADGLIKKIVDSAKMSEEEAKAMQNLAKDHSSLKVKVDRLKGLLGRSAKAQREAKVELECSQKKLDQALRDVQRLKKKVEHLSSRPTHMDLLNDFETNFDRALLSVGTGQTGGQDTAAPQTSSVDISERQSAVDTMLIQELEECRQRLSKLESLNSALVKRSSQLEADAREKKRERDDAIQKLSHMDLELRMSRMEASHAQRAMEEKAASLEEMQMEIDMVTKASMKANTRAAQGEAIAKSSKTDRQHVLTLEAQVAALKEWALASAESKRLALERVSALEKKIKIQSGGKLETTLSEEGIGRTVFSKSGSMVIGAGDVGYFVAGPEKAVKAGVILQLRWKFDSTPSDLDTEFNVMKGKCETLNEQSAATYLIKGRAVTGGAAGVLENAFTTQNACTLLWSNRKSWVRPRTVKYEIEILHFEL